MTPGTRAFRILGYLGLSALAAAIIAAATVRIVRPDRPNLADPGIWTLIKAATTTGGEELRVYSFRRDSSTWDPYGVRQNRIVIGSRSGNPIRQFMWPSANGFAAGWCEISDASGGGVAVVLFEGENAVRVVHYGNGGFTFRPDRDELILPCALRYVAEGVTRQVSFVCANTDKPQSWSWSLSRGFVETGETGTVP